MVFLGKKKIKGHTYWYASERGLVDGKIKHTNKKKIEELTVGEYLLLNIIGRCDGALSENAMQ
ncbi:MAG: hypothetical protein ACT6FG_08740, partial [Methanosarcinaceae archaeon]